MRKLAHYPSPHPVSGNLIQLILLLKMIRGQIQTSSFFTLPNFFLRQDKITTEYQKSEL